MKKITEYILIIVLLVMIVNAYYLPFYATSIQSNKDIFDIISKLIGSATSIIAIIIGYYYYTNRKNADKEEAKKRQTKNRVSEILIYLNEYDKNITEILYKCCKDDTDLSLRRTTSERLWDNIECMLSLDEILFAVEGNELKKILSVHSYVEKNVLIMSAEHASIRDADMTDVISDYKTRMNISRKQCFAKIE